MVRVKKALVVDDSRLARIALSKLLQRRNVDVDTVATGTEALTYLQTTRPDVVFMDFMMPDMDGFEATRRIRSLPGNTDIPVVMYTAQENETDRERAEALGIVGFLTKPSGEESLEEILDSLERLSSEPSPTKVPAEPTSPVDKAPEPPLPAAAEPAPATQAEPAREIDWQEIRNAAREAAEAKAIEAAEQLVQRHIGSLREELERAINKAGEAAQESSNALLEKTARRIAQDTAREAIERFGKGIEATPAENIKADIRRELRDHMTELLAADVFRQQFTEIVLETALPRLRAALVEETLPHIRDRILEDAQRLARDAALDTAAQAARDATSQQIAESLTEYRMQDDDRVRALVQASASHLRRWLYIGAGLGLALVIAGVAASVYLSTHGVPF
ncbi:MAG: response regulator [Nitrococcus sp.]|nr:response regulator [Nitrococcus sp.]